MRLSLFVALAVVASVTSLDSSKNAVVYKPGEEYVYHYKGHVLNGIPMGSDHYSGLFIDTLVILQFHQDKKVALKLDKIKLFKINNQISTRPLQPLSETEVTRLTGEQARVLSEHLVRPIKFRYEEGEVRELQKESGDRFWSVNIKKGILSLFQITLKEKASLSDSSFLRSSNVQSYKPLSHNWGQNKLNSVYKVIESDVTGDCENQYTVIHDRSRMSMSVSTMHVTTVRNFENCITRPFYIQGLFQGVSRNPSEKSLVQPQVHTDYVITGDRSHFLIQEATLRGKYLFLLNGVKGIALSSFVYQSLSLKTTDSIRTPFHLNEPKSESRGLLMIIPNSSILPERQTIDEEDTLKRGSISKIRSKLENDDDDDDDSKNDDDKNDDNEEDDDDVKLNDDKDDDVSNGSNGDVAALEGRSACSRRTAI
jgi:hypothetical protein